MNKRKYWGCLLAALLMLTGCGNDNAAGTAAPEADTSTPEAAESFTPAETPEVSTEPVVPEESIPAAATVTTGQLVYTMDYDMMLLDADSTGSWFVVSRMDKGYGSPYYAINPGSGQIIQGEEGAEVVLCANGIVRFLWKDSSGHEVSADMVYFMSGEPQSYTLWAQLYSLDGALLEERELLTWTQSMDDPYFTLVLPAMEKIVAELGGGNVMGYDIPLSVTADGTDTVVSSADGELLRLLNTAPDGIYAYGSQNGTMLSVYLPDMDETDFYLF